MYHRFISFVRSDKKKALLRYFLYEVRGDLNSLLKRIFPGTLFSTGKSDGKINLAGQAGRMYGSHRSGWSFAVTSLRELHNPGGILVDAFIDRTFAADSVRRTTYSEPWVGFIHVPPQVPEWLHSQQSNEAIFATPEWKQSVPFCRGLYTLSAYHQKHLNPLFDFPVEHLIHPTAFPDLTWSPERFSANRDKKIIQSGWWLRKVTSIYLLEVKNYRKFVLMKQDADAEMNMKLELEHLQLGDKLGNRELHSVEKTGFLSDRKYDQWLSENIVFLDLFDASASNAVIECIARNTPLLVNPLEAVVEYLGDGYPLYFKSMDEAAGKADDMDLVHEAHRYLAAMPGKEKLTGEYFKNSIEHSQIYRALESR
ncbi:MAG: hypothetical protein NT040_05905 [Bacteroidetes bacterium]|nr:hypothetical protein [Bacteroidota bacterium]